MGSLAGVTICFYRYTRQSFLNMGRGKVLTAIEKGQIQALASQNMSGNKIAQELRRSRHVVQNFLRQHERYGTKKSSGRPSSFTLRDRRRILRAASNQATSLNEIKARLHIRQSTSTIWRAIRSSGTISRDKMRRAPKLQVHHKTKRLQWAREKMTWSSEWRRIIFTDEKSGI